MLEDLGLNINKIEVGQRLDGLVSNKIVTILALERIDDDLAELVCQDSGGNLLRRTVTSSDLKQVMVASEPNEVPVFNADPNEFRLAAEALRIKYAALYDPMVAINSSDVDPLPHQIRAVYGELLPRIPLRFLLADDPGAGKTIMAGLYLKELILRSDCERAIIVAPGGLVEQWREELGQKFDLHFEVFSRQMVIDAQGQNVFCDHPFLIARMDQLSRDEALMEQLSEVSWDVAVVDEAHRMSARFDGWAGEVKMTNRFKLGRLLSGTAHNLLLMTATPHAGKEEDFQLFMSLLDEDRFEGKFREGVHRTDTEGLMRRMVKEDLLTFEGKPLFPERHAKTVAYELSNDEQHLYEQVTEYVRTEMGRAEQIGEDGDKKRRNNVGFALTMLQRRLASSPEAILRSLERRQQRLSSKLMETRRYTQDLRYDTGQVIELEGAPEPDNSCDFMGHIPSSFTVESLDLYDDELSDEERWSIEETAEQVIDLATASRNTAELQAEIDTLEELIVLARRVRYSDQDRKWIELREILDVQLLTDNKSQQIRKIIIFTEHRDTLNYLQSKIATQFGREDAVITIHGGTTREERKLARERFTHNPETVVLLATDAAGEGLNLQRAHLMVNYDLPWNPNRIEQRFGRIHRIGQREVCYLWNMVAKNTREGDVFIRLLTKISNMSKAYNGNLFNVLGESKAFHEQPLRSLIIEAIRYGSDPDRKKALDEIIDAGVAEGLEELTKKRALHSGMISTLDLDALRDRMELARERRLQPGYIAAFFVPAFARLGGRMSKREKGRYEITRVPQRVIDEARRINRWAPVPEQYERVTFEIALMHPDGQVAAELLAPGHALLQAVINVTIHDLEPTLENGTVFIDRREEQSDTPSLMYAVEQRIENDMDEPTTVSHHFDYPLLSQDGKVTVSAVPPYLDFDSPVGEEANAISRVLRGAWVRTPHDKDIRAVLFREGLQPRMEEVKARIKVEIERTRQQVEDRLLAEMNHWDREYSRLDELERSGTIGKVRASSALKRSQQLEQRMATRFAELDQAAKLVAQKALIRGTALVIPSRLLKEESTQDLSADAEARRMIERRAVDAVIAAERKLGRNPIEMARNNPGYDIRSTNDLGQVFYIEVKGRIEGADAFTITANEVTFAKTQQDRHRLALVMVSPDGASHDQVRYVCGAFNHIEASATTRSFNEDWAEYWNRGGAPR